MNKIPESDATIIEAYFGKGPGHSVGLSEVLQHVEHVDLIDFDAQGGEYFLAATPEDVKVLREKVYRIHIETHSHELDEYLPKVLVSHGFIIMDTVPMTSNVSTGVGTVFWRGGRIKAVNPAFVEPC